MKKFLFPVMLALTLLTLSCSNGSNDTVVETDPEFTHIAESWGPQVFSLDMGDYWQAQGITHAGKTII